MATLPATRISSRVIGSIASNGSRFVAVSDREGMGTLTSPDGITWTHHLPPGGIGSGIDPDKIHFFNGKYYGIMRTGFTNDLFEFDATTSVWTRHPVANLNTGMRWADVGFVNGTFAIVAANGTTVLTSTNKTTWTSHTVPMMSSGFQSIRDNGNGFIAVGATASGTSSYAITGVLNAGTWWWTPTVITSVGSYQMSDVIVVNGKTIVTGPVYDGVRYTVSPRVSAAGGGTVSASSISVSSGDSASFLAYPNAGNVVLSVSGCGASFVGNTITTSAITANCTVTITFGAPCTLDIDDDGAVLPTTDGLLVLRRILSLGNQGLRAQAHNPLGNRTDPIAMAALMDPMITTKTLDIDGNGSVTAATDGLLLLRALLGFGGTAVTDGALGTGTKSRGDWSLIRQYLSSTCGLGAVLAP